LDDANKVRSTVGKFLGIRSGEALLVGVITNVSIETPLLAKELGCHSTAALDLMGEIKQSTAVPAQFQRGVTEYPAIGDPVFAVSARELRLVFNVASASGIEIGHMQQDSTIGAYVGVDDMLSKHFAVPGTTGVGKSSAVVLMLQEILRARPDLRISCSTPTTNMAACSATRRSSSIRAICGCRSGCSISRRWSTSCQALARASTNQHTALDEGPKDVRAPDGKSLEARSPEVRSPEVRAPGPAAASPLQPTHAPDPSRGGLLKRPLGDRLDISKAFQAPPQA